jgi:hypothetical protein
MLSERSRHRTICAARLVCVYSAAESDHSRAVALVKTTRNDTYAGPRPSEGLLFSSANHRAISKA